MLQFIQLPQRHVATTCTIGLFPLVIIVMLWRRSQHRKTTRCWILHRIPLCTIQQGDKLRIILNRHRDLICTCVQRTRPILKQPRLVGSQVVKARWMSFLHTSNQNIEQEGTLRNSRSSSDSNSSTFYQKESLDTNSDSTTGESTTASALQTALPATGQH